MQQLKSWIGFLIVAAGFYLAWMLIPPYYNHLTFQDDVESEARLASYNTQKSDQDVAETLAKRAKELDIPLTADEIHVQRTGSELSVTANYRVKVNTIFRPIELTFTTATKNKRI